MSFVVNLSHIEEARARVRSLIQETQLGFSRSCSAWLGTDIYLKFENQQITGSFKIRGALNKILGMTDAERRPGFVAMSAGNHAQGVAYAATKVGAKADIVMPVSSPLVKISATQGYGANVILHGTVVDEAYTYARQLADERKAVFVHPYEDPKIIAGQGTLGLELMESVRDLDSVVVPIGGGGLISGVAIAVKSVNPRCKIYGVVAENAPGMYKMFKGDRSGKFERKPTIADGIAVKQPSNMMFEQFISKLVDDVVAVGDDEIAEAIVFLLERGKAVVEGAGAAALAGARKAGWDLGRKSCIVLSGGNIDMNIVSKVIERGLTRKGRLARIEVVVQDKPGTLLELTSIIAKMGANVLDVKHDRQRPDLHLSETAIEFLLETRGPEDIQKMRNSLLDLGVRLVEK